MKTVLHELIHWTIENAFNVEGIDGINYIAIDHEEMRIKFKEWLDAERAQIINATKYGFKNVDCTNSDISFDLYYEEKFNETTSFLRNQLNYNNPVSDIRELISQTKI